GPEPELRQVTPDRPLTSDPVSGEWAVASGLGGGIAPAPTARRGRSLSLPDSGSSPGVSDWDRLTGTASGRGQVGERGPWDFFDEPAGEGDGEGAVAPPGPAGASGTMSLPRWTEPPPRRRPCPSPAAGDAGRPPRPALRPAAGPPATTWRVVGRAVGQEARWGPWAEAAGTGWVAGPATSPPG